jgi:hypothetical protein
MGLIEFEPSTALDLFGRRNRHPGAGLFTNNCWSQRLRIRKRRMFRSFRF